MRGVFCWEGGLSRGQCEEEAGGGLGCGGLARLQRAEAVRSVEDPPGETLGGAAFGRLRLAECFRRGIGFSFSRFTVAPLIPSALGMMDHRGPEVDKLDLRNLFPGFAARISRPERHPGTIPPATYRSPPGNPSRLGCPPRHSACSNLGPPPPQSSPGCHTARKDKAPEVEEASPGDLESRRLRRRDPLHRGLPLGTPAFVTKIAFPRLPEEGGGQPAPTGCRLSTPTAEAHCGSGAGGCPPVAGNRLGLGRYPDELDPDSELPRAEIT